MPQYVSYSPWTDAANSLSGATQGIGALALQVPQLRAQQMQLKQQQALIPFKQAQYQANAQRYGAQADLYKAQTERETQGTEGLAGLAAAIQKGDYKTALGQMAYMGSKNPQQLAEAIMRMDAYANSGLGSQGGQYSPQNAEFSAGGNMKPVNISQGGIAAYPDQSVVTGQMNLAPGHVQALPQGAGIGAMSPYPPSQPKGSPTNTLNNILAKAMADGNIDEAQARKIMGLFSPDQKQPVMPMGATPENVGGGGGTPAPEDLANLGNQIAAQHPELSKEQIKGLIMQRMQRGGGGGQPSPLSGPQHILPTPPAPSGPMLNWETEPKMMTPGGGAFPGQGVYQQPTVDWNDPVIQNILKKYMGPSPQAMAEIQNYVQGATQVFKAGGNTYDLR